MDKLGQINHKTVWGLSIVYKVMEEVMPIIPHYSSLGRMPVVCAQSEWAMRYALLRIGCFSAIPSQKYMAIITSQTDKSGLFKIRVDLLINLHWKIFSIFSWLLGTYIMQNWPSKVETKWMTLTSHKDSDTRKCGKT